MKVCLVTAPTATDFEHANEALSMEVRDAAAEPHLGILSLASVLDRAGVRPHIVNLNRAYYEYLKEGDDSGVAGFAAWAARSIVSSGATVYGLSSLCSSYPLTLRIAECIKRAAPDCTILLGGPQASVVDLQTLAAFPFVDFILRGEAERTLPLFLDELGGNQRFATVPSLTYRSPFGPSSNASAPI